MLTSRFRRHSVSAKGSSMKNNEIDDVYQKLKPYDQYGALGFSR